MYNCKTAPATGTGAPRPFDASFYTATLLIDSKVNGNDIDVICKPRDPATPASTESFRISDAATAREIYLHWEGPGREGLQDFPLFSGHLREKGIIN